MLGIRREDKNEWERRVPLTPRHVSEMVSREGLAILVESSAKRAYPDDLFREAGGRVTEDLADATLVIGIKEVPLEKLQRGKAYLCFSHTIKGQPGNMPTLKRILDLGCTLLDYEPIVDDSGRRLIFFGRHAGYAGMIDGLWALGRRLASEGHATPFDALRPAHEYGSLDEARQHIGQVGERIRAEGIPEALRPLVIGITGTGNVSLGAREILDDLPLVEIAPERLADVPDGGGPANAVHCTVFDLAERFEKIGGGPVTIAELSSNPERFTNRMLNWLPHVTLLANGMYWVEALPRLLSLADLKALWPSGGLGRLRVIADIACDIDGAVEATVKATTPDAPAYVYDVDVDGPVEGFVGNGPAILSVDNLPAELPLEASADFGDTLLPFVPHLARCDWSRPLDELALPPELSRAIIAHQGRLTPRFQYLKRALES